MKNNIKEIIITALLVLIAVLLLNPLHFWMPSILVMCMLFVLLVLFGAFASFVFREKDFDERDSLHRTLAGRNAFLAGSAVLIIGIIVQELREALDPWLIIALIAMVFVKIGTRVWSDRNL